MNVDGIDVTIGSMHDESAGNAARTAALRGGVQVVPEPASSEEVAAILAVAPRGCRNDATWAVPLLIDTARGGGITHTRRIAYVLATAHHESRFGAQLTETQPPAVSCGEVAYFDRFEPGTPAGNARGNSQPGDGLRFRGRGFVHVKGRANYATWSQRLGMPDHIVDGQSIPFFVAFPEAMARPNIAAQTLVRGMRDGIFTGIALGYYVNDKKTDYYNARRVIDGTSQAREVAALAVAYQTAIEDVATERHRANMRRLAGRRGTDATRDICPDIADAVKRLALRGEIMPYPVAVVDWNGEARQGKFVQIDERTCALHVGRSLYVRLDIQRDLNGVVPPEGKNMVLKRSGDVRAAVRTSAEEFWR